MATLVVVWPAAGGYASCRGRGGLDRALRVARSDGESRTAAVPNAPAADPPLGRGLAWHRRATRRCGSRQPPHRRFRRGAARTRSSAIHGREKGPAPVPHVVRVRPAVVRRDAPVRSVHGPHGAPRLDTHTGAFGPLAGEGPRGTEPAPFSEPVVPVEEAAALAVEFADGRDLGAVAVAVREDDAPCLQLVDAFEQVRHPHAHAAPIRL